jgi:dTDP-L-rhamnose 4-epimerase
MIDQVHCGADAQLPDGVELRCHDIRDAAAMTRAVAEVDAVVHLAAEVGVGQSMYAIERYVSVNDGGTAVLFDALARHPVRRVVVASSMSIYGEGLYQTLDGRIVADAVRPGNSLQGWDPVDQRGLRLLPLPTPEWKSPRLSSVYALTKFAQERLTMITAPAYGIEAVALRLFNVFGPGQSLSNPYTGVLAIFASRLANGEPPLVFEDGQQMRDFVHVADVAGAFVDALYASDASGKVLNIGSGRQYKICDVASLLAEVMGRPDIAPQVLGKARVGDIRHCVADIGAARVALGYEPRRHLEDSLDELCDWVARQTAVDRVPQMRAELEARGLVA